MPEKFTYKEKFEIMDREALATLLCAFAITAFFWLAIYLLKDCGVMLLQMPAWFTVSCLGGYLLSIIGVVFVVKRFFKDFSLDENTSGDAEAEK